MSVVVHPYYVLPGEVLVQADVAPQRLTFRKQRFYGVYAKSETEAKRIQADYRAGREHEITHLSLDGRIFSFEAVRNGEISLAPRSGAVGAGMALPTGAVVTSPDGVRVAVFRIGKP